MCSTSEPSCRRLVKDFFSLNKWVQNLVSSTAECHSHCWIQALTLALAPSSPWFFFEALLSSPERKGTYLDSREVRRSCDRRKVLQAQGKVIRSMKWDTNPFSPVTDIGRNFLDHMWRLWAFSRQLVSFAPFSIIRNTGGSMPLFEIESMATILVNWWFCSFGVSGCSIWMEGI